MKPSELAWVLADYRAQDVEPPARCVSNPEMTEGEMMSEEETEEFLKDSLVTLKILADKNSPRYEYVLDTYRADLKYLFEVGQIDEDDYNGLTDETNTRF